MQSVLDGIGGRLGSEELELTAATLLAAETAPTARVDCRRAFRNILREICEDLDGRGAIAATCNWGEGRLGLRCCLLQESKWRFSGGPDGSRVCEGVGGAKLAQPPNQGLVRGFACKFRGCLNNFPYLGGSLRNQPPTGKGAGQVVPGFAGSVGETGSCGSCGPARHSNAAGIFLDRVTVVAHISFDYSLP